MKNRSQQIIVFDYFPLLQCVLLSKLGRVTFDTYIEKLNINFPNQKSNLSKAFSNHIKLPIDTTTRVSTV